MSQTLQKRWFFVPTGGAYLKRYRIQNLIQPAQTRGTHYSSRRIYDRCMCSSSWLVTPRQNIENVSNSTKKVVFCSDWRSLFKAISHPELNPTGSNPRYIIPRGEYTTAVCALHPGWSTQDKLLRMTKNIQKKEKKRQNGGSY